MKTLQIILLCLSSLFSFGCAAPDVGAKIGIALLQIGGTEWIKSRPYTGPGSTNQQPVTVVTSNTNTCTDLSTNVIEITN